MAKADKTADKSDTSNEEEMPVEAKISEDVVDAEIIEETTGEAAVEEEADDAAEEPVEETAETALVDEAASESSEAEETSTEEPSVETEGEETEAESEASEPEAVDETPADVAEQPVQAERTEAPVKKTGFMQVALGGVVAAALGFGVSQYVGPLSAEKDPALVELEGIVKAQSAQIEALLEGQTETQTALAAAQATLTTASGTVEGLTGAVAAVNGRIDDAAGALATLDGRIAVIEKQPITQSLPSAAIEAYEREVEELKAAVASQRAEAASMEENAKLTAQQALARAALSRVLSALDSGAPYRVALTDFSAATGTAAPADLEAHADNGVTSLATLQSEFPDAARVALAASRNGEQVEGNKLTSFFKAQLGARSVTPQEGDSADAVLSRAEDALRAGRVTDALAELATLPEVAQPAFAAWTAKANARQAAFAAGEALSQQLNTN